MKNKSLWIRALLGGAILAALMWVEIPRVLSHVPMGPNGDVALWVADQYIPAYAPVTLKHLRKARWPRAYVPPGALLVQESLTDNLERPRFSAAVAVPEGQPLTRTLLFDAQSGESISSLLRPGQVAVSFQVERSKGAGGWVRPGDIVAVFSETTQAAAGLRLIMPSITVLAVDDKRLSPEPAKATVHSSEEETIPQPIPSSLVITVRANPLEASSLIKASERGSVHIVVRSSGDELPWTAVN